jgi:exodeoxyribonuclease VIII
MNGTEQAEAMAALYGNALPEPVWARQPIDPVPTGVYRGVPEDIYHGAPGVSKSGLDRINRSPAHFRAGQSGDTAAQLIGRATHCAVLEPDDFRRRYAEGPEKLQADKDKKAKQKLEAQGYSVLRPNEMEHVLAIQEAVWAHPAARFLLSDGEAEVSAWWRDDATGELCKCRPDLVRPDNILADLKTTRDASPEGFTREAWKYRYHVQAAFYSEGWEKAAGVTVPAFLWIAVEPEPPYPVAVYAADSKQFRLGAQEADENLHTFHTCRVTGEWPAYSNEIQTLGLPAWVANRMGTTDE